MNRVCQDIRNNSGEIERATVFVPDLTFVAARPKGEPTPNPNVLIEYGYALKSFGEKGERRIMPVMNIAYGAPTRETMPFHLIEHRNAITYNLPEKADADTRKAQQKELAKKFESALKVFFASEFYKSGLPKLAPVTFREPLQRRARSREAGKPIGVPPDNFAVHWAKGATRSIWRMVQPCGFVLGRKRRSNRS